LVSGPILGLDPIRILPIGDSIIVVVTQSITDAVSVFIHKHHPILKLQFVLGIRFSANLVAISHLTWVIRKNDPTCQDQNGPD
jgi:hypothetical protein